MASCELKTIVGLDQDQSSIRVDVVAVRGLSDRSDGPWVTDDATEGLPSFFVDVFGSTVRFSVFSYSLESVLLRPDLKDTAANLLKALLDVRKEDDKKLVIFLCHDIGITVVKEALLAAIFGDSRSRQLAASVAAFIFMGCPHITDGKDELQESIIRLGGLNESATLKLSSMLAQHLAKSVLLTNQAFLETKLLHNTLIYNITSSHEDLAERIFESRETSLYIGNQDNTCVQQVTYSSSHATLGADYAWDLQSYVRYSLEAHISSGDALVIRPSYLINEIPGATLSSPIDLLVGPTASSSHIIENEKFQRWCSVPFNSFLAIHDATHATETAKAIASHLASNISGEPRLTQFFEFRTWDCRYNTIESMLLRFLGELSCFSTWPATLLENFRTMVKEHHAWSLHLLLSTYQNYILGGSTENQECEIVWVLTNLDARIQSYEWLLSKLCAFAAQSEYRFRVVIVNQTPLNLGPSADSFITISSDEARSEPEQPSSESVPAQGVNPDEAKRSEDQGEDDQKDRKDPVIDAAQALELFAECPNLYNSKKHVERILLKCEADLHLRDMAKAWLKLRAADLGADLDKSLASVDAVSPESILWRLWISPYLSADTKKQITTATELLLYSARAFTTAELYDLENKTSYGQEIGHSAAIHPHRTYSTRTLFLVPNITCVQNGEIQFSHAHFRDLLLGERPDIEDFPVFDEDSARRTHARMARWCLERIFAASDSDLEALQAGDEDVIMPEFREDFLSYSIRYWVQHAKLAGLETGHCDAARKLIEDRDRLIAWNKAYWSSRGPATRGSLLSSTPLAVFASHGLEDLLSVAMEKYKTLPSFQHECFQALRHAARGGESNAVRKLLACPRPDGEALDNVVTNGFASGSQDTWREVIKASTALENCLQDPLRVLKMASFHGLPDAVRMLIPLVPRDHLQDEGYEVVVSAIHGGGLKDTGSLEALRLLHAANLPFRAPKQQEGSEDNGDDSDAEDPSALEMAAKLGSQAISEFLAETAAPPALDTGTDTDSPDASSPAAWSNDFRQATLAAVKSRHYEVLRTLLNIALKNAWKDTESLKSLMLETWHRKSTKCWDVVVAYLLKTTEPGERKDIVHQIITPVTLVATEVIILRSMIDIAGGLDPESFSSLLTAAVQFDDKALDLVKLLTEEGAKACPPEAFQKAVNEAFALAVDDNYPKIMSFLLGKNPPLNDFSLRDRTPLYHAAYRGYEEVLKILLEAKADPNAPGSADEGAWKPLHGSYDNATITEALLNAGARVNDKTGSGSPALWHACRYNFTNVVQVLVDHGADVNAFDTESKDSVLSAAAMAENLETMTILLEAGADPLRYPAKDLETPLIHSCVRWDMVDILKLLLLYNIDVNERDSSGNAPMHVISWRTNVSVLKLLASRGATLESENSDGMTPLSIAIEAENEEAAKFLIAAHVNINVGRSDTVLHSACLKCSPELVRLLVEAGADVNRNSAEIVGIPIQAALRRQEDDEQKHEILTYLLGRDDIDIEQTSRWWGPSLNVACLCATPALVTEMLARKANVNANGDVMGRRPIHFALYRTMEHVKLLCEAGADLFARDLMERSALHFAVVSGRLDIVRHVLHQKKELAHAVDVDGWNALMWAVRECGRWDTQTSEREEIVRELLEYGSDRMVQGKGLDRKWTAYELSRYYGLDPAVVELVTPKEEELAKLQGNDKAWWKYTIQTQTKHARTDFDAYCDACLLGAAGIGFTCDVCSGFYLCFKCYRSRDTIHPGHNFTSSDPNDEYEAESESDASSTTSSGSGGHDGTGSQAEAENKSGSGEDSEAEEESEDGSE